MSTSTAPTRAASVTAERSTSPFILRLALCVVLTAFNGIIVAKFAGVLYLATSHHPFQQAGVTLLFAALLGSLARTWFITLSGRP
jgi:hypothetical protein